MDTMLLLKASLPRTPIKVLDADRRERELQTPREKELRDLEAALAGIG
jgi:hypothetical protein